MSTSGSVSLYSVDVPTCEVNGTSLHPIGVNINYQVGKYGDCSITHAGEDATPASEEAIPVTSKEAYETMGKRQDLLFKERSEPDFKVTLKTKKEYGDAIADGANVQFEGLLSGSSLNGGMGGFTIQDGAIDKFALLDSLDLSIYSTKQVDRIVTLEITLENCEYSIPKMISKITKFIMEQPYNEEGKVKTDFGTKSREAQHKINEKVVEIFYKLLDDSEQTFGWKKALKDLPTHEGLDEAIRTFIENSLRAASGSFLATLAGLAAQFKALLVPDSEDPSSPPVMRLKSMAFAMSRNTLGIKLPQQAIGVQTAGMSGLFPIRYVAVVRPTPGLERANVGSPDEIIASYPMENVKAGGSPVRDLGPAWLPQSFFTQTEIPEDGEPDEEEEPSEGATEEAISEAESDYKQQQQARCQICYEWAKLTYLWNALQGTGTGISMPLVQNVAAGQRYVVYNSDGDELFSGFAQGVSYHMMGGTSKTASVAISLSHVTLPGFELPMDADDDSEFI